LRFDHLAYKEPDDLVFGFAKYPLRYGLGLTVGDGKVVPEVKYLLKPGLERSPETFIEEYKKTTVSIVERAANLGFYDVQLETEFVEPMTVNPKLGALVIEAQKTIMDDYHKKFGDKDGA